MKQLFITVFLTFTFFLHAQYLYDIEMGVPITSTDAISTNPSTIVLEAQNKVLMFYEKRNSEADHSEIWVRDIENMTEALSIYNGNDIDYLNPRAIRLTESQQPSQLILFYTTYDGNEYNVKYVKWDTELNFEEPEIFATTTNDPKVRIQYQGTIAWVDGESLKATSISLNEGDISFEDIEIIDNGVFKDIRLVLGINNHPQIYYVKSGDVDYLFKNTKAYSGWGTPIELDSGIITNLSTCNMEAPFPMEDSFAVWNNGDIAYANDNNNEAIPQYFTQSSTLLDSTIFHATAFSYYIPVKEKYFPDYFLIIVSDYTGQDDIYLTENPLTPDQALSNDLYSHGNISLHTGLSGSGYWTYTFCEIIWETYIDDKTVLYHTHFQWDFASEITENTKLDAFKLQLTPNPISTHTNISFTTKNNSDIQLFIYTTKGESIFNKTISNINVGQNSITLNELQELKSGVYFLKLTQGNTKQIKKFIVK